MLQIEDVTTFYGELFALNINVAIILLTMEIGSLYQSRTFKMNLKLGATLEQNQHYVTLIDNHKFH